MSCATFPTCKTPIHWLGEVTLNLVCGVGDLAIFGIGMLRWFIFRGIPPGVFWINLYRIGVQSLPVVIVTGAFIGMVLAVQTYDQLRVMGIETRLGSVVNISLLKELGPVLAATMLAGRVGSAIAAELGTMRVTEQIDALTALGANPIHYLGVPRFLACVLLIPALTLVADGVGMLAGWQFSMHVLNINSFHYWYHSYAYIGLCDVFTGVFKSIFFGGSIALVACHRGFHSRAGAEGVGKAATESFVYSFVLILMIDFLAGVFLSELYPLLFGLQSSFL